MNRLLYRPVIAEGWTPSLQYHERSLARTIAMAAAVLSLIIIPIYHLVEWLAFEISPALLAQHGLWRAQAMVVALVALAWCLYHRQGRGAVIVLRVLALSLMVMMFGLLFANIVTAVGDPHRMIHGLIMTTFAIALISLRGAPELAFYFLAPLLTMLAVLHLSGSPMRSIVPLLLEPVMMLGVGLIASELLYRTRMQSFAAREELKQLASTDPLTGLNNRRFIEPQLEGEVSRAKRHNSHFSVLLADLDHFKQVNDQYGHDIGDGVLREIALRISSQLRREDRAARWGGEEFLVLLPETEIEQAMIVAEKIRAVVGEQPIKVDGFTIPLTISLGVASTAGDSDARTLVRRADQALYRAKQSGRNRACVDRQVDHLKRADS